MLIFVENIGQKYDFQGGSGVVSGSTFDKIDVFHICLDMDGMI